jgi:hypothetical protein
MDKGLIKIWGAFLRFFTMGSFILKKKMKNLIEDFLIPIKCQYVLAKILACQHTMTYKK